jgi:calcium-binding protein CML
MGAVLGRQDTHKRSSHGSKLEAKMVDAMQQRALHGTSLKSFDSIVMKFPRIDESFRKCKTIFEQFGEPCTFCLCSEPLFTLLISFHDHSS